jgi:hypothetical protein
MVDQARLNILKICTAPGALVPLFAQYAGISLGQLPPVDLSAIISKALEGIALEGICDDDDRTWEALNTGLAKIATLPEADKSALVDTWNYVYVQSASCGVYRSSSMGFTFRDPGGKHKVQVGMYVDMTLKEDGHPVDHKPGEPHHRLRLGSLDVPACLSGSDGHCECPTGVGRDDVELRGVACTANSDASAAANKAYVDETVECAIRSMPAASDRRIYTVVDASEFKVGTDGAVFTVTSSVSAGDATAVTQKIDIAGTVAVVKKDQVWSITAPALTTAPDQKGLVTPFLVRLFKIDASPEVYSVQAAKDSTDLDPKWVVQLHDDSVPVVDGLFRVDESLVVNKCGVLSVAKDTHHASVTTGAVTTGEMTFLDTRAVAADPGCEMGNAIKSKKADGCRATLLIDAKQLCITCNVSQSSDEKLKRDVRTIPRALEMCRMMRGVEFKWTDRDARGGYQMGVIAQEVERVYPSLVDRSDGGFLGVDYAKLVGMLIEAVKELDCEVARLRGIVGE